jgi:protein-tyrosine phosphatase
MRPDDKDVFEYGDRTIFNLRAQSFNPEEDFGTMILPVEPKAELPPPLPLPGEDHLVRLEQKLDAMMRKIESIDATLARLLAR